ncbi:MAG: DNA repair protein RecO [Armatimonadetes bacterium]|nr:DNA repair protein RecO [Armatimonadota bacterium]
MAEQTVTALVVSRRDSGESDRRLTLLTRELGRVEAVAKGARKGGSRLAGSSEPLVCGQYQLAPGRQTTFITQVQVHTSFPGLRADYERLTLALALTQAVAAFAEDPTLAAENFDLLLRGLNLLEHHSNPLLVWLWSMLHALELEGVMASFLECVDSGEQIRENPVLVSPTAGGLVSRAAANQYVDAYPALAEACIGLGKLAELNSPPNVMKHAKEAFFVLAPIVRYQAHKNLPAMDAASKLVQELP